MEEIKSASEKIAGSLSSGRCPVCAMLRQDEFDILCEWVGKSDDKYNGSNFRDRLLASNGFCNYHFWEFERISSHYGSARVASGLLEQLIRTLRTGKRENLAVALKERGPTGASRCPLCFDLEQKEIGYLRELEMMLREDMYKTMYLEGCGLCIPHFIKFLDYARNDSVVEFLFQSENSQTDKIRASAMNFISKRAPHRRGEQTEDEKKSYFRAIEKLVGRRGV